MTAPGPSIVVLSGATASGKTALGVSLAQRFDAEVVSADSIQIYRRLAVGSARPTLEEQGGVRHHLLDFVDLDEPYDAARFRDDADRAIADIHARGKRALIVGGAGLYLRALVYGLAEGIPSDAAIRAKLLARLDEGDAETLQTMHAEVAAIDPAYAAKIHPNDPIRITRALEVWQLTGIALSEHHRRHQALPPRYTAKWLCLETDRAALRERIAHRAKAMLNAGWIDEVRTILADGYAPDLKPLESVGYAEVVSHVLGRLPRAGLDDVIALATAGFAKRQRTWFRGERGVAWVRPERLDEPAFAASLFEDTPS